ncbi:helix-turn-helix transcriptional regulator [Vagococcus fluvialis]|uniref:helix-turn-helix transcriptional regulator n=1 Tax=Vagococcus fluvialis TaxID=2738 RepID=UPI003D108DD8
MNVIAGYRRMLGYTQKDMAEALNISKQSYWLKENKKVSFSDNEKIKFKELLVPLFPNISIDQIFFT